MQDRGREPGGRGERRVGVQRVAVAAEPVEQRLLRRDVVRRVAVRLRGRGSRPRSRSRGRRPSRPRRARRSRTATVHSVSPASRVAVPSCQITAALPLSHTSVIRVRSVADPNVGSGPVDLDRLAAVDDLREVDVAAGQVERRRVGLVEGRRDDAEAGQHLEVVVVEGVAQGGGIEVVARRPTRRRCRGGRAARRCSPTRRCGRGARRRSRRRGRWASGRLRLDRSARVVSSPSRRLLRNLLRNQRLLRNLLNHWVAMSSAAR